MNITNTDRKFIERLFELKPDATGKDVVKLIEELNKLDTRYNLKFEVDYFIKKAIIEKSNKGWTFVSKGLPKERILEDGYHEPSDSVLVFMKSGMMYVSRYWSRDEHGWMDLYYPTTDTVVAWMPLPAGPYKKGA